MPAPSQRRTLPLPTGRGWWLVAGGVAAGLLVFLLLWIGQRSEREPYRPDEQPPSAEAPVFEPLPIPPPEGLAADADVPLQSSGARIDEPEPSAAPPMVAEPGAGPGATPAAPGSPQAAIELSASSPVPIESPRPRYPARALRRGESGEVLLRIQVDARGVPSDVEVASSSGSRDLDRAATSAARRWRFRPAMRDGRPVAGTVTVPVNFDNRR